MEGSERSVGEGRGSVGKKRSLGTCTTKQDAARHDRCESRRASSAGCTRPATKYSCNSILLWTCSNSLGVRCSSAARAPERGQIDMGSKIHLYKTRRHIDSGSHPSVAVMCPAIRYSPCKTRPKKKINKARCCNECVVPREGVMRQSLCARPGRPCAHAGARCPRLRRSRPLSLRHICARRPWPSQATRNHLGWRKHTELST